MGRTIQTCSVISYSLGMVVGISAMAIEDAPLKFCLSALFGVASGLIVMAIFRRLESVNSP